MRLQALVTICLALPASTATIAAQEPAKLSVAVNTTADDAIGSRLVYAFKEGIRASRGLQLVSEPNALMVIHIVSADSSPAGSPGLSTAYSMVFTLNIDHAKCGPRYWKQFVGTCGAARVKDCGDSMVAETDKIASEDFK